jgi:hypothetical protein
MGPKYFLRKNEKRVIKLKLVARNTTGDIADIRADQYSFSFGYCDLGLWIYSSLSNNYKIEKYKELWFG